MMARPFMNREPAALHLFRGQWLDANGIAALVGVTKRTIHRRIQLGLPLDGTPRMGPEPRRFYFRGRLADTKEIMAETGLSRSQVSKRTDGIRFFERHELQDPNAEPHPVAHMLFFKGIRDSITGWARRTGIPRHVISERLRHGWPLKRALTEPAMRGGQRTTFYRNRRIIRRLAIAFRTGGYDQTFAAPLGTGGGRFPDDLHRRSNPEAGQ